MGHGGDPEALKGKARADQKRLQPLGGHWARTSRDREPRMVLLAVLVPGQVVEAPEIA